MSGQARKRYDIGMIVPLEAELDAVLSTFPSRENLSTEDLYLHELDSGVPDISMVLVHQNAMGHAAAGVATRELLQRADVGLLVCVGIAGGLSDDLNLGDVCYTGMVYDIYENSRAVDKAGAAALELEFSPLPFETDTLITIALNFARTQPEVRPLHEKWSAERHAVAKALLPHGVSLGRNSEAIEAPGSQNGSLTTGVVSKSKAYNKAVLKIERKMLAIETEAGAVFAEAKKRKIEALTVRGISDFADANKGELEAKSKGTIRALAAQNAVTFFKMQLANPFFVKQLHRLRPNTQMGLFAPAVFQSGSEVGDVVAATANLIESRMREYSPEYKGQPKGYRVPVPRIRRHAELSSSARSRMPVELRDALRLDKRILVSIPKGFPNQSLPWVLSHDLLEAEFDGKQVVPIVIDASEMAPPAKGLLKVSEIDVTGVLSKPGQHPVFILERLPLASPTKMKFILDEIGRQTDAHFIVVAEPGTELVAAGNFKSAAGITRYDLSEVSFQEIARFIQRNFDMDPTGAEVVAKKLWDVFQQFDLYAHPTYFAGIPKDTLLALMHANRRAELIQIAVDGFLTIVVAGDESEISLSRTTRSRFLSELAVDLLIERRRVLSDLRYLVSANGRGYWPPGDPNDANFLQTSPISSDRHSARSLAVLSLHSQPARC